MPHPIARLAAAELFGTLSVRPRQPAAPREQITGLILGWSLLDLASFPFPTRLRSHRVPRCPDGGRLGVDLIPLPNGARRSG